MPISHVPEAPIVGVWYVQAQSAPFAHHMFVFHADGTMLQSNPDFGNADTSDSSGMGIWRNSGPSVQGKFVEINCDRKTRAFASRGVIEYELTVSGDLFTGSAAASFYDAADRLLRGPLVTPLLGSRVRF